MSFSKESLAGGNQNEASNIIDFESDKLDFKLSNDPQQEFFFNIIEGLPPIVKKRRLFEGCLAGCLSRQNCEIMISALGLRGV